MLRKSRAPVPRARAGTACLEFVVALPLLALVCMVAVDCGRFAFSFLALSNAVRVGAEMGGTNSVTSVNQAAWQSSVQAAVSQELSDVSHFDVTLLTVTVTVSGDSYNLNRVTVSATYPFQPLLKWPGISGVVPMGQTLCVRQFR